MRSAVQKTYENVKKIVILNGVSCTVLDNFLSYGEILELARLDDVEEDIEVYAGYKNTLFYRLIESDVIRIKDGLILIARDSRTVPRKVSENS